MKHSYLFPLFFAVLFSMSTLNLFAQQPIIPNGSFEQHDFLPGKISIRLQYDSNQFMKCIGKCPVFPHSWPPYLCDGSLRMEGWYWPTYTGSSDYFHILGREGFKVPFIHTSSSSDTLSQENRWPFGYDQTNHNDSAFIGLRHGIPDWLNKYGKEHWFYKEYAQIKFDQQLPTGIYKVSYNVSCARNSYATIKKICAYFSTNPITSSDNSYSNLIIPYFKEPQICSDVRLDGMADSLGYGGWQEISDTLIVKGGSNYNYLTIGNFQNDIDFWNDCDSVNSYENLYDFGIYYFVDNVRIEFIAQLPNECNCTVNIYDFQTKPLFDSISNKCCYEWTLNYPEKTCIDCYVCQVAKFQLIRNGDTLQTITPTNGDYFEPDLENKGIFCLDDFSADLENDNTYILFYKKEGNNYIPLTECAKRIKLNCKCDCSDLTDFPYPEDKLEFRLIKVDSSIAGKCCWDLIVSNLDTTNSKACKYDLSEKHMLINSSYPIALNYSFSPNIGTISSFGINSFYWDAPQNFLIKPGEVVNLGRFCTFGLQIEEITLDFTIYNDDWDIKLPCKKVMTKKIQCAPAPSHCCDLISLTHQTERKPGDGNILVVEYGTQGNQLVHTCSYAFSLKFENSTSFCDYNDTLEISLYNGSNPSVTLYATNLTMRDLYNSPLFLQNVAVATGQKIICIDIKNLRTNEHCQKCDTVNCIDPNMAIINNINEENSNVPTNEITIVPNPVENTFDVIYNSKDSGIMMSATLINNLGQKISKNSLKTRKGYNSVNFSTSDLSSGIYYIQINADGKNFTKKIIINK